MAQYSPTGETLHRLLHAYKRAMRDGYAAADIDLTVGEIRVLKGIARSRHGTARHIAERMRQDKGRIARLIKGLVTAGLVVRQPHPDDNRSQQLELTDAGRELAARIASVEARAGARMAGGLSDTDLARFTDLAEAMITNLEHAQDRAS
ncbi:MarR family winged helix-turn-helix transcriptional regulator [Salinisphaera sp. SWV1]|uniref:MarR family winged helix-turn-helix transcriptional regulator n=1 Tax=Salinisphaera sp. SWV1 TaxID=3454139 RepID=UPI003F845567